ncbi:MAG: ATP-binding cassette domain-containing protein [Candidatus Cloacimonadales bacterium]|jgi:ABC-type sugar transport system ATPase subunit|nr:ATP-binding cassette domain-containing protein [Candidatus Cloacimonadota bacterium]MDD2650083.1 ATP-binding cassette domain-containing protein [Candidatus Cloacimonadota bacterium]MDD3501087.1 ATP-binding cassette domain-containing protein [Candidatus Cloacimonadota bacterium]MDX9976744.1 ATP-binding cassette domain-containing protein [Candidatus Cloacimonadales bacterium]
MLEINKFELANHSEIILEIENLIVNAGEFIYFLGANSTGKSLLLSTLAACYHNFNGSIVLNKKHISDKNYNKLVRIIHNDNLVFPNQSILDNIGFNDKNKIELNDELIDLLLQFKIPFESKINCSFLSQSEIKCVELIRAYTQKPMMLIFDDLDNYFDSQQFESIYKLLVKMKKQGTIIISSGKSEFNKEKQYIIENKGLLLK